MVLPCKSFCNLCDMSSLEPGCSQFALIRPPGDRPVASKNCRIWPHMFPYRVGVPTTTTSAPTSSSIVQTGILENSFWNSPTPIFSGTPEGSISGTHRSTADTMVHRHCHFAVLFAIYQRHHRRRMCGSGFGCNAEQQQKEGAVLPFSHALFALTLSNKHLVVTTRKALKEGTSSGMCTCSWSSMEEIAHQYVFIHYCTKLYIIRGRRLQDAYSIPGSPGSDAIHRILPCHRTLALKLFLLHLRACPGSLQIN